MAEENNNNQNQNNVNDQSQNNDQNNQQQNQNQNQNNQNNNNNNVDMKKVQDDAVQAYLKSLGFDDEESLKTVITKQKEAEDAGKTDLQKANDTLTATTKELVEERKARSIAEAKITAIQLGAKPELVDDLVTIAIARTTKDKDVKTIITEMKSNVASSVYFNFDEEQKEEKPNNKNITRKESSKKKTEKEQNNNNNEGNEHDGSIAARIMSRKKTIKPHYFK